MSTLWCRLDQDVSDRFGLACWAGGGGWRRRRTRTREAPGKRLRVTIGAAFLVLLHRGNARVPAWFPHCAWCRASDVGRVMSVMCCSALRASSGGCRGTNSGGASLCLFPRRLLDHSRECVRAHLHDVVLVVAADGLSELQFLLRARILARTEVDHG